jgi:ubiquinol-cytochrome c reductase subunit 6
MSFTTPTDKSGDAFPSSVKTMIERGQDPKDMLIEFCRPSCKFYEDKLRRCETAMKNLTGSDPEKNCMYPLRDWVTCVEGCV